MSLKRVISKKPKRFKNAAINVKKFALIDKDIIGL
jgi:hypothetical protein